MQTIYPTRLAELWCWIIALIRLTLIDDAAIKQWEINEYKWPGEKLTRGEDVSDRKSRGAPSQIPVLVDDEDDVVPIVNEVGDQSRSTLAERIPD